MPIAHNGQIWRGAMARTGASRANSRENRVYVCCDVVERPQVEEAKYRRPVPL